MPGSRYSWRLHRESDSESWALRVKVAASKAPGRACGRVRACAHLVQTRPDWRHVTGKYQYQAQKHAHRAPGATNMILVLSLLISFNFCWSPAAEEKRIDRQQDGWRGSRMKERRSFSFGCAKIHELPISIFLLSFSLSPLSVSPVFPVSLSPPLSPSLSFPLSVFLLSLQHP